MKVTRHVDSRAHVSDGGAFDVTFETSGLFQANLKRGDFPGVSSARGLAALVAVPVERLPAPPTGFDYVVHEGAALMIVDTFLNVNGRVNYDGMRVPGFGWLQDAMNSVGSTLYGNYPEVMPTVLVRARRDGRYAQYTPEMHVDAKTGRMGIQLDRLLGFGFNKQPSTIRANNNGTRFDVTGPRGSYSVEQASNGRAASAAERAFWDVMKTQVPALGRTSIGHPRSLFNRALPASWDEFGEPIRESATAVAIRGDGLRHLGIEPGVYPGFNYARFQGLTFPAR